MDSFPAPRGLVPLANIDNDRIYLVTETGLVQCLHDADLPEPLYQNADRPIEKPKEEAHKPVAHKPAEHKPAEHKPPAEPRPKREPKVKAKKDAGDAPPPKKVRKNKKSAARDDAGGLGGGKAPDPFGGGK